MPSSAILHEAQQLHNVSDRLDSLAGEHPVISEALISECLGLQWADVNFDESQIRVRRTLDTGKSWKAEEPGVESTHSAASDSDGIRTEIEARDAHP